MSKPDRCKYPNPAMLEVPIRLRRLSNDPEDIDVVCVAERSGAQLLWERAPIPVPNPDGDGFCQMILYITKDKKTYKLEMQGLAKFLELCAQGADMDNA